MRSETKIKMRYSRSLRGSAASTIWRRFAHHDVGGAPSLLGVALPTAADEKPSQAWELECHALFAVLATKGYASTDELRRVIEALPLVAHTEWGYYERWSVAMETILQERGILSGSELEAELFADDDDSSSSAADAASGSRSPRFAAGDEVLVQRNEHLRTAWRAPHLRTPGYVFGARGVVERHAGTFGDPSLLAYRVRSGAQQHLYRVRFTASELWPEVNHINAADGGNEDSVDVEIYENCLLAPSDEDDACAVHRGPNDITPAVSHAGSADEHHSHSTHEHEHHHGEPLPHHDDNDDNAHHDHHHDHVHLARPAVEFNAVVAEGPAPPGSAVHRGLLQIALRRELVTREEIRSTIEALETAGVEMHGARLIARAWVDDAFKARLLEDGNAAAAELGLNASNPNAPTKLTVVENDARVHNLIVCTLCSCYPAALLGPSPTWYKSRSYRARAVREPRALLSRDFGLDVGHATSLRVHDSTADLRYLVLPRRPERTEGLGEEELRKIVTRDGMLGVAEV